MLRRTTTLLRGLAAAVVLLLALAGIPFGLVAEVGWPLPTTVPTWDQVAHAITTGSIEDASIIKTLAVLVWLAWANFVAGLLLECVALAHGRQARRVAGTRTAQQLAANLLTSISLAVAMLSRPTVAGADPEPTTLRLAVATTLPEDSPMATTPAGGSLDRPMQAIVYEVSPAPDAARPRLATAAEGRLYEVQRGDTLWDLAERFLGDGYGWREIRDANVGRVQPDGTAIRADDEDIRAGWTLLLPDRASAPAAADMTGAEPFDGAVTVESGDTLWNLADEHLGDPFRWPEIYEENEGQPQADGRSLTDPDLIHPGWVIDLPEIDEPEAFLAPEVGKQPTTAEPSEVGSSAGHAGHPDEVGGDRAADDEEVPDRGSGVAGSPIDSPIAGAAMPSEEPETEPSPTTVESPTAPSETLESVSQTRARDAGEPEVSFHEGSADEADESPLVLASSSAALAAGVILTLDRLRRARLRRREPGTRIPLPEEEAASAEQRLRALADEGTAAFVDLALRELAEASEPGRFPPVVVVSHGSEDLSVRLASARPDPPSGWEAHDEGRTWVRPRPVDAADLEAIAGTPSRLPALVTLGTVDGRRTALLNLGNARCLHLDGDAQRTTQLLRAWALELATTSRADALDILAYGLDGLPSGLERLEQIESEEQLRGRLAAPPPTSAHLPTTVVLAASVDRHLASWVRTATEQRSDLVAAIAAPPPRSNAWAVRVNGESGHFLPGDLEFDVLDVDSSTLVSASRLLEQAKHDDDEPVPIPELREEDGGPDEVGRSEPAITVRILGPVRVEGAGSFKTNKTMELVVFLAMHRRGVDTDTLQEALWPNQSPRAARLYTEASRARKALGTAPDGSPYLPDAEMGLYRLSQEVALDYEEFQAHVVAARRDPGGAEHHLRAALDLVGGKPLSVTATEYTWSINDSYRISQEIVDAAHQLARLMLAAERYEDANSVAEAGLKADPLAEVLVRDLMEVAAATGNTARVRALMTRLRRQLAEDGDANDADDWLHPETLATYERLAARSHDTLAR